MKLYSVSDGPPSLLVRMALKAFDIPYEKIDIDFIKGEHMTEQVRKYIWFSPDLLHDLVLQKFTEFAE